MWLFSESTNSLVCFCFFWFCLHTPVWILICVKTAPVVLCHVHTVSCRWTVDSATAGAPRCCRKGEREQHILLTRSIHRWVGGGESRRVFTLSNVIHRALSICRRKTCLTRTYCTFYINIFNRNCSSLTPSQKHIPTEETIHVVGGDIWVFTWPLLSPLKAWTSPVRFPVRIDSSVSQKNTEFRGDHKQSSSFPAPLGKPDEPLQSDNVNSFGATVGVWGKPEG